MAFMARLFFSLFLILASHNAHAWNATGHRLVAIIAWQKLSSDARVYWYGVLAQHPDFHRWESRPIKGLEYKISAFAEAAVWADRIRQDERFFDEGQQPETPLLPGFPTMARHRHWHYVDFDLNTGRREGIGQLDAKLRQLIDALYLETNSTRLSHALVWLLHLLADAHQPLHCASNHDSGGNDFQIENPYHSRNPFMSLHQYWDDLPGPSWASGIKLKELASKWQEEFPDPNQGDGQAWVHESLELARAYGYPREMGSLLPIVTPDFHRQAQMLTRRQISTAGGRLGNLLMAAFQARHVSRETQTSRNTAP